LDGEDKMDVEGIRGDIVSDVTDTPNDGIVLHEDGGGGGAEGV